ncbi:MAG: hypothetical protein QXY50_07350, partial [Candidatus Caldarchaeum sp.]
SSSILSFLQGCPGVSYFFLILLGSPILQQTRHNHDINIVVCSRCCGVIRQSLNNLVIRMQAWRSTTS